MALTLTEETQNRLTAFAARRGLSPDATLDALLGSALAEAERDFDEAVADVRASMADFAAGRSMSLDEYRAQTLARRRQRNAERPKRGGEPQRKTA